MWKDGNRKCVEVQALAREYTSELDQDIRKLQSILGQLQHLADSCHGNQRPECPIIDDLAAAQRGEMAQAER